MDKTRLFPACEWICEKCGRNNFTSMMTSDLPAEVIQSMKEELREELGVEEVHGDFMLQPTTVKCRFCETQYEAEFDSN